MSDALRFTKGRVPLLISMPHPGTRLTPAVERGLVAAGHALPDTDWHIPQLYGMATELGASCLEATYSRYVVDLNRPADDVPLYSGATTGLFTEVLFDGSPLFQKGKAPGAEARQQALSEIWQPYHHALVQELKRLRETFGYALLWDAHSICSRVPRLFEGQLPDLNFGTFEGASCDPELAGRLKAVAADQQGLTYVFNGRFKGGYITRQYGVPGEHVHAVQLELAQRTYMDEAPPFSYRKDLAAPTQAVLRRLLETTLAWGRERYGR
ncbi:MULTISPECIES: N-formylglutamate deformylase [unclassified Pseudomonas]|uniref:N-formylglutamate deformylase n=1 Tax=unclassified Pseudomonas TaxID=196821 RepID=UPI000BD5022E|nr:MULTISPECIES: N-formylglutamate deformylase [unclassified Pseudomonas]PVZ20659.1 formiminoglutamase [Pseudomonas sp. URIL14HWK12:I12]PVZ27725.1 formiminoglutamase [Pseudomonas sp. URIL14HWK12:I10]PVZ38614.1 formiminoglutamase [Pseudomonas sp. URIL14HWK12:I11]SNZ02656.1 formiminoglutamase [Pseudomonas sp. URIL14HWK12:I9]